MIVADGENRRTASHREVSCPPCCCCRPTPPVCSCGGVRQPSFSDQQGRHSLGRQPEVQYPGLDSMSPARSRHSASHAAGTHGWLPQKTGRPGLRRGGVGGYNLHSVPPDCGTPTTSRLYPFGAPVPHPFQHLR